MEWLSASKLALRPHEITNPIGRAARNLAVQEIAVPLHEVFSCIEMSGAIVGGFHLVLLAMGKLALDHLRSEGMRFLLAFFVADRREAGAEAGPRKVIFE